MSVPLALAFTAKKVLLMILLIDNYDSFTYNLVQRLGEIDPSLDLDVHRNDQITVEEIEAIRPSHFIISPGPCTPDEAGVSLACVKRFSGKMPLLGVCFGASFDRTGVRRHRPLPPTFPAQRVPNRAKHPGKAHRPREKWHWDTM